MTETPEGSTTGNIVAITPDGRPSETVIRLVQTDVNRIVWLDSALRRDGETESGELGNMRIARIIVHDCRVAWYANYVPLVLSLVPPERVSADATASVVKWDEVIERKR